MAQAMSRADAVEPNHVERGELVVVPTADPANTESVESRQGAAHRSRSNSPDEVRAAPLDEKSGRG